MEYVVHFTEYMSVKLLMKCTQMQQVDGLPELKPHHICADYLKSLIHVVPQFGARDDAGKYCIGGFAIDLYSGLLQDR